VCDSVSLHHLLQQVSDVIHCQTVNAVVKLKAAGSNLDVSPSLLRPLFVFHYVQVCRPQSVLSVISVLPMECLCCVLGSGLLVA
jgi:hypothetical protein